MSTCRVFSCVVGRGCLLWPVRFLGKTLLVFAKMGSIKDRNGMDTQYVSFGNWLLILCMMSSDFICVTVCARTSFLFKAEWYSTVCFYPFRFSVRLPVATGWPPGFSGLPGGSVSKGSASNAGDTRDPSPVPGLGRSPGEGNGNPLQYSCLENPMDGGAW